MESTDQWPDHQDLWEQHRPGVMVICELVPTWHLLHMLCRASTATRTDSALALQVAMAGLWSALANIGQYSTALRGLGVQAEIVRPPQSFTAGVSRSCICLLTRPTRQHLAVPKASCSLSSRPCGT